MKIFLGADGIKTAYELSLNTSSLDIQCLSKNYKEVLGDWFEVSYGPRLYKSDITTREIVYGKPGKNTPELKENLVRFVDDRCESDIMISDNLVFIIKYSVKNPYALVVEDSEVAASFRGMFEARWKEAS